MIDQLTINWMRSRPPVVKDLLRQFPPGCWVMIGDDVPCCEKHECEMDMLKGVPIPVCMWSELGTVGIGPEDDFLRMQPEWLTVVRYEDGLEPADVERILA